MQFCVDSDFDCCRNSKRPPTPLPPASLSEPMRRYLNTNTAVGSWSVLQRTAAAEAQVSVSVPSQAARRVSTASLPPRWLVDCTAASLPASGPASSGRAISLARDTLKCLTLQISIWLAAPKRKVLFPIVLRWVTHANLSAAASRTSCDCFCTRPS